MTPVPDHFGSTAGPVDQARGREADTHLGLDRYLHHVAPRGCTGNVEEDADPDDQKEWQDLAGRPHWRQQGAAHPPRRKVRDRSDARFRLVVPKPGTGRGSRATLRRCQSTRERNTDKAHPAPDRVVARAGQAARRTPAGPAGRAHPRTPRRRCVSKSGFRNPKRDINGRGRRATPRSTSRSAARGSRRSGRP